MKTDKKDNYILSELLENGNNRHMTYMTELLQALNQINETDSICLFVCNKIKEIIGKGYVSVTLMGTDEISIILKAMKGFEDKGLINSVIRLLGQDPRGAKFSTKDMTESELASFRSGKLELLPGGMYSLITRKYPKILCTGIEKLLKIRFVYTIGFIHHNRHLGGVTILIDSKTAIEENTEIIENIVNQSAIYLSRTHIEEELRRSLFYNRALIEASLDPLVTIGQDGKITDVNLATEEVTGLKLSELVGNDFSDYFTEPGCAKEGYKKVLSEGFVKDYPLAIRHHSGKTTDVLYNATLYKNSTGEIEGVFAAARDITELKKIENILKQSEEKYRTLVEKADEAITILQDGIFVFANNKICKLVGKQKGELEGKPFIDFIWPEERERLASYHKRRMAGEILPSNFEFRIIGADGSPVWLSVSITKIQYMGKPAILNLATDITRQKQLNEILNENKKTAELYLNIIAEIIVCLDTKGNITLLNDSGSVMLGYNHDELIGKNWFKTCLPVEMADTIFKDFEKIINGEIESLEIHDNPIITKSGKIKTILWHNNLLKDLNQNIIGTISSGLDITDRKKAEDQIHVLSLHDHLTGLYNRRFFEEELKRLDTKRQLPLSFIIGDLNGLKIINDAFGHAQGDRLLKKTAEILKKVCRSEDILARWGGDEFVILLPKTSIVDTEVVIARIKKQCNDTNGHRIPLSLSLGTATKETMAHDIQTIIIRAESNMYKNKLAQKESISGSIVSALEATIYEKSLETKKHTDRIKVLALKLGEKINLSLNQLDDLSLLASLHDLGKIAIPEEILLKEGKLTKQEWEVIKRHPEIGFNIASSSTQISHISRAILSCHENFDGSGYPLKIKGESIPIISRIILIADAYDVMLMGRSYKKAISKNKVIKELKRCSGTLFDPMLVDKFISIIEEE
jgi:diguanylate cyclase (GGDEF)-like protein/PAS domain S-box-containing protein